MVDAYSYGALPSDSHIRYLLLEPGQSGDPLVCSLHVTELEDQTPFEAISYVWGTSERTEPIQCDGKTLYVTPNLRDSLVAVRRPDEARALWSDSICINQGNSEEKAQQVSLMAEIYRKSTRTLICLGLNDDGGHAEAASGIVTTVNHMMDEVFRDENFSWEPSSFPSLPDSDPLLSDPRWESVAILAGQPWFKRCWVVQEAAFGPVAEIIWGGVHIDWLQLLRAFFWVQAKAWTIRYSVFRAVEISWLHLVSFERLFPRECIAIAAVGYPQSWPLLQILKGCEGLGATDPRDRIYACIRLPHSTTFQGPQVTALKPDYDKPYLQVYHDFACAYLEATGMSLDLLGFTQINDYNGVPADGPSWVPRWDKNIYTPIYRLPSRRHSSQYPDRMSSVPCLVDQNTLKVGGVRIGSVQYATDRLSYDMSLETIGQIWRKIESIGIGQNPYHESATAAFVGTLNAGNFQGDIDEWERREIAYMDYVKWQTSQQVGGAEGETVTSATAEEDEEDIAASSDEFHNIMMGMGMSHNRKLIVSDRGYYGLALSAVKKGDDIFIIFGTTSPFILRHTSASSPHGAEQYKLVGDMFMYSAVGAGSDERLQQMGKAEGYDDWHDWDPEEHDIFIC